MDKDSKKDNVAKAAQGSKSGLAPCSVSNRLADESHRTFWQTGAFRDGRNKDRLAWVMQRYIEQSPVVNFNPFL